MEICLFDELRNKLPAPYFFLIVQSVTPVKSNPWSAREDAGSFIQLIFKVELLGVWSLHLKQRRELSIHVAIPVLHVVNTLPFHVQVGLVLAFALTLPPEVNEF